MLLETRVAGDGQLEVSILRRIEEVLHLDSETPRPWNDEGVLTVDPGELRGSPPAAPPSD